MCGGVSGWVRTYLNVCFCQRDHLRQQLLHMEILEFIPLVCSLTASVRECMRVYVDMCTWRIGGGREGGREGGGGRGREGGRREGGREGGRLLSFT